MAFALHALEETGARTGAVSEDEEGGFSTIIPKDIQQLTGVFGRAIIKGEGYRPGHSTGSDDLACGDISGPERRRQRSAGKTCQNESRRGMHAGENLRLLERNGMGGSLNSDNRRRLYTPRQGLPYVCGCELSRPSLHHRTNHIVPGLEVLIPGLQSGRCDNSGCRIPGKQRWLEC